MDWLICQPDVDWLLDDGFDFLWKKNEDRYVLNEIKHKKKF